MAMRNFEPDYYERLHVGRGADTDEIRSAFRKMAKESHPDKSHGSNDDFVKVRRAYEVLSDEALREEYNRYLDLLIGQDSFLEIRPAVRDLYDDMVGYLKQITGFRNRSEYELVLKKEYRDRDKIVKIGIPLEMVCRNCFGTGGTIFGDCPVCRGKGKHMYQEDVDLFIPAGSEGGEEMKLTFSGQEVRLRLRFR
ncbi:MAG TPA: hypothetical protein ENO07_05000 [candidate division Zixibacteria bacterium]|nr:hypothetical protein [candidate division Zixibacteria bacterium]